MAARLSRDMEPGTRMGVLTFGLLALVDCVLVLVFSVDFPNADDFTSYLLPLNRCPITGAARTRRATAADLRRRQSCSRRGLLASLKKFDRFARNFNLPKIVPEIAVSRRAGGAAAYLKDALYALKRIDAGWFYLTLTERGNAPFNLRCADNSGESCQWLPLTRSSRRQTVLEKYFAEVQGVRLE